MKPRKMLITMIASYLCFLLLSFLLTMLLVPHVLQHYLHGISSDPAWQDALHGASVAIQNTCYIMVAFVMLLSLIPFLAIYFKLYRPGCVMPQRQLPAIWKRIPPNRRSPTTGMMSLDV